jgi:uncharacterized protein (DUF433 family)
MNHEDKIVRDPQICGGEPVFRGTRVTLRTVLASLAAGDAAEEILADFPALKAEHLQAAIAFAAASSEDDLPVPGHSALLTQRKRSMPKAKAPSRSGPSDTRRCLPNTFIVNRSCAMSRNFGAE